jgi:hypothetical protein
VTDEREKVQVSSVTFSSLLVPWDRSLFPSFLHIFSNTSPLESIRKVRHIVCPLSVEPSERWSLVVRLMVYATSNDKSTICLIFLFLCLESFTVSPSNPLSSLSLSPSNPSNPLSPNDPSSPLSQNKILCIRCLRIEFIVSPSSPSNPHCHRPTHIKSGISEPPFESGVSIQSFESGVSILWDRQ